MYSKYEEMVVIRDLLNQYIGSQKQGYDGYVQELKSITQQKTLGIDDLKGQKDLLSTIDLIQIYLANYNKGMGVAQELSKATSCYEQAYTQDNIQSGLAGEKGKKGNSLFFELKTKNTDYQEIMSELAMDLWSKYDIHISGLGLDLEGHLAKLEQSFTSGNITKEQFIYYINMSNALLNTPQYVDYMQQFYQEDMSQMEHK